MPAYSIEFSVDHHFWKRNSNSRHYMFEMDLQLWFLDKNDCPSGRKTKCFETKDINQHHPLLASISEALNEYQDFLEPHLKSYQLQCLGELLDFLFSRYNPHNSQYSSCLSWSSHPRIFWHRSRSGDRIFYPLIKRKINFALGDAPGDAGELANYTFKEKALFSSLLRGAAAEWYEKNNTNFLGACSNKFHH